MSRKALNLTSRVAAVFRAVKKLERRGHNKDGDYDFTRATDVFEEVRDRLFKQGILLCRDEAEPQFVDKETNGGEWVQECRLRVTYWFSDGESETKPEHCNGVSRKFDDKALYVAQTGADKAFLKRKGLMAEVVDDPEFDRAPAGETLDDAAPMRTPRKEMPLARYQVENVQEACAKTGKTAEQLSQICAGRFHAASLEEVKRKHFKDLFKWAADGQGTITTPKLTAVPAQGQLQLRAAPAAPQMIDLKLGNKTVTLPAPKDAYAL